jgi:hypothetical protein
MLFLARMLFWPAGRAGFPGRKRRRRFGLPGIRFFDAVDHVVSWGLEHRMLGQIDAIGVDETPRATWVDKESCYKRVLKSRLRSTGTKLRELLPNVQVNNLRPSNNA